MPDRRIVLQFLKGEVTYHRQVDSDPDTSQDPRRETENDLTGDALKQYEADIEAMNLILISILNDIYNSVDSCQTAREIWLMVERLIEGTVLSMVDRETWFNYEFDQFVQYEKLVIASRVKKLEKTHDPLALVAHTSSSSKSPPAYYVTHPPSVVDYDDEYKGDTFPIYLEDSLTTAMMLLSCTITQ
ncbi:hypothetical protein Tco_1580903, partial [Tanacetum coccineum]